MDTVDAPIPDVSDDTPSLTHPQQIYQHQVKISLRNLT